MRQLIRSLVLGLCAGLFLAPSSASADVVTKSDPWGDTSPRLDITRVTYTNGPGEVRTRMRIPHLERLGTARFMIGAPNSDVAYIASVTIEGDGQMKKRFSFQTNVTNPTKPCAFKVEWRAVEGYIKIVVPQSCIKLIDNRRPLYLAARTGNLHRIDWAPAAKHLVRG